MSKDFPLFRLGDVALPVYRQEQPVPGKVYRQIGVKLWGRGAYERQRIDGGQTRYRMLWRVEPGDIIVNKIWARNGSVAVVPEALAGCYASNEFPIFTAIPEKLEPRWFHWLTKTHMVWVQCDEKSRGTSGKNRIRPEQFLDIKIPLPSISEQRRIVARIDELAAKIKDAHGLRHQALDEAEALWTSGAQSKFTALTHAGVQPLRELVTVRGGGTPSKANPFFWRGSVPLICPKDMKSREIRDAMDHISEEAISSSPAKLLDPGSVLIVVRGMILAHTVPSAVLRVPATINQDMKALIPNKNLTPEYLCSALWALNHRILDLVERSTHDTRKLETLKLLDFTIPVPALNEQHCIVAYLEELQAKADGLKRLQAETATELDALLPSILDKAFKGELR